MWSKLSIRLIRHCDDDNDYFLMMMRTMVKTVVTLLVICWR